MYLMPIFYGLDGEGAVCSQECIDKLQEHEKEIGDELDDSEVYIKDAMDRTSALSDNAGDIKILEELFVESFKKYKILNNNYDCSEIAEDLDLLAGGLGGEIFRLSPKNYLDEITIIEYGKEINVKYHDIFVLNGIVYDPRYSKDSKLVPLREYIGKIGEINTIDIVVKLAD